MWCESFWRLEVLTESAVASTDAMGRVAGLQAPAVLLVHQVYNPDPCVLG